MASNWSWKLDGACSKLAEEKGWEFVDNLFFADHRGQKYLKYCTNCPVQVRCKLEALIEAPATLFGVWGGTTQRLRIEVHQEYPELIEKLRQEAGWVPAVDSEFESDPEIAETQNVLHLKQFEFLPDGSFVERELLLVLS